MSFTKKRIDVTIKLGKGQFGEDGVNDTVTLTGHRTIVNISAPGGGSMGALQMRMYGLTPDLMNKLTTIGPINATVVKNSVYVSAGDETGMSQIYAGTISEAWGDFQPPPDVSFNIVALCGLIEAVKPIPPVSYKVPTDAATIMASIAKTMGVAFENNGVTAQIHDPYYPGTAWQQAQTCSMAGDFRMVLDRGTLAIWPKSGARGGGIPLISPATGLVGYPAFSSKNLTITCTFNPNIIPGGQIDVQSSITMARGRMNVVGVSHAIESERPGGAWFTRIECFPATSTGTT